MNETFNKNAKGENAGDSCPPNRYRSEFNLDHYTLYTLYFRRGLWHNV